ncbi:glycosyltransferase [Candidatus Gracilibacteria bacterium]|nr:glycosyltransferase [Candidatus Gracilibacteria bacterium]
MNKKIKIAFLAPETKGGPYYLYKDIVDFFERNYNEEIEVYFFNSRFDWLRLHFKHYDVVCSVIPFLFKPIGVEKYIYNPRGNFDIEKKKNKLGNKLLYLARNNLEFADRVWLNSYFLADKLNFKKLYDQKICIIPDFITIDGKSKIRKNPHGGDEIKILTVSSTKFLEKALGTVDLKKQLSKVTDSNITWTIIAGGNKENFEKVKDQFDAITLPNNLKIEWIDWVGKDILKDYYKESDIFLYGTRLDTWGGVIMEAMSYGLPVILLEYELWKYIYPKKIITNNIINKISDIEKNYKEYSELSLDFIGSFDRNEVCENIRKQLIKR